MKIKIIFFIFSILFFAKISLAYELSVAKKYNEIFTKNILYQNDIENYRQIYLFQKNCKWKSANRYILKISNKIFKSKCIHKLFI